MKAQLFGDILAVASDCVSQHTSSVMTAPTPSSYIHTYIYKYIYIYMHTHKYRHHVGVPFSNQYYKCRAQSLGGPEGNVPKSTEKFCLPCYSAHSSGLKFCSSPLAGAEPPLPWTTLVSNKHFRAGGGTSSCQIPNSLWFLLFPLQCQGLSDSCSACPSCELSSKNWQSRRAVGAPQVWKKLLTQLTQKKRSQQENTNTNTAQNCPVKLSQWVDLFPPPLLPN